MNENRRGKIEESKQQSLQLKANYSVFTAQDENELILAAQNFLEILPLTSIFYVLSENGLQQKFSVNPNIKLNIDLAPDIFALSNEELAKLLTAPPKVNSRNETDLSEFIKIFLNSTNCGHLISLPIIRETKLFGLLILFEYENPISPEILASILQLTEIMSIVLENISQKKNTLLRLNMLEDFFKIEQVITTSNDLPTIYKSLHSLIVSSMGNVEFAIAIYDPTNEIIEFPYVSENGSLVTHPKFPFGEGVLSVVIKTRQPLMLTRDTEFHLNALGTRIIGKPAKSWLGCPLLINNGVIGIIVLQDLENEDRFTQENLQFLMSISSRASQSINYFLHIEAAHRYQSNLLSIIEITNQSAKQHVLDDALRIANNLLCEYFSFFHSAIYLVKDPFEYAVIRVAAGSASQQLMNSGSKVEVGSKSVIGYVTKIKELLVVNNIGRNNYYSENPLLSETKSEACFPLLSGDRILGVLDIQSTQTYFFTNELIEILKIFSEQLASTISTLEQLSEAQERISQHRLLHHIISAAAAATSSKETLQNVAQGLYVAMGGTQISILMADSAQSSLEVKASIGYANQESARLRVPFGVGVTGWVAAHRQVIRISDTTKDPRYISLNPKIRSELAVPLIYRNELLGVINIESVRVNAFSESDGDTLETLAESLAAVLAHSRLLEEYRIQAEREHRLYQITNKIRRTTNPSTIISLTAEELTKTLNARRTQIEINPEKIQKSSDDILSEKKFEK